MKKAWQNFRLVLKKRGSRPVLTISFLTLFALFSLILPATFTGGRVGFISLQFLTPALAGFAFIFALFLALIITINVYLVRHRLSASAKESAGGVLAAILPALLCCSPLLPTLFAFLGVFIAPVAGLAGPVQGFLATYELYILGGASLLLLYAFYKNLLSLNHPLVEAALERL